MPLRKVDIETALRMLGEKAREANQEVRLLLTGGAAMSLVFDNRLITKDVDVVIIEPADVSAARRWAEQVATELDLPENWLNDAVKGYIRPPVVETEIMSAPGIKVVIPSLQQLAAMKLSARRDDLDIADAETIMKRLKDEGAGEDEVWDAMQPYLVPGAELKAQYTFKELWDRI